MVAARVTKAGGGFQAEEAWRLGSDRGPNFASPIAIGDHLYTLAGNEVACLDLRTGEQAWSQKGVVFTDGEQRLRRLPRHGRPHPRAQ
ncbi:MAG: hypothetical protein R3F11_01690 [Verrucomicrobiales bacterium]